MSLPTAAKGMLAIRSSFGLTYTPAWTSAPVRAGWPVDQLTPAARFFAAVFGVRELLMVAMVLRASKSTDAALRDALRASAAIDGFDAAAAVPVAVTQPRLRRPAVMSAVTAAASCALGASGAAAVR